MLIQAISSVRDLGRLHDIASVLIRYGFGEMVRRMGLEKALERTGKVLHWTGADELAQLPLPVKVRRALEELGPAFVKLGQVLSTRVDLFDAEWIAEFSRLQDGAAPVDVEAIRAQLTEDLGAPPEEVFAFFDPKPLAAGSIAQVHRARLADGTEVIVKVRRPGIRPVIEADLRWLARLAQMAESESPELRHFSPQEVVKQFARSMRDEMDFAVESRNASRVAANFRGYRDTDASVDGSIPAAVDLPIPDVIVIPKVYWQYSGERVCVQQYIDGIAGRRLDLVDQAGMDRTLLARRGAHAVLKMIVEDGFFHADPHPGNVFFMPGHRIAFIDFGMVGRLSETRRDQLMRLLVGLVRQEADRVANVLFDWTGNGATDEEGLAQDIQSFVDQYRGVPLKQIRFGNALHDVADILRSHQVSIPTDLTMLIKAFVSLEGMGMELDPDFDMAGEAMPMLEAAMRARYAPGAVLKRSWKSTVEMLSLIADLPQDVSRLLRAARRGRLEIHIDVTHLKHVGNQLDKAANRLVIGLVIAALIIGSSIVMTVESAPRFLGVMGFIVACIGTAWLLLSIIKSNREDRD
jgi:ubiquinone biosynthesis protein